MKQPDKQLSKRSSVTNPLSPRTPSKDVNKKYKFKTKILLEEDTVIVDDPDQEIFHNVFSVQLSNKVWTFAAFSR